MPSWREDYSRPTCVLVVVVGPLLLLYAAFRLKLGAVDKRIEATSV
jgi:hypothetical protein